MPAPHARLDPAELAVWSHFPDYRNEIPVLAYHGVNSKSSYLTVTRRRFAEQLLALHTAGFHTVTISQYARYMKTGSTAGLPSKPILLTFDDGRLDSYQGADKTLAKYHDTAVMFVVASWPDEDPGWALHWNELVKMQQSGRWEIQEHAGAGHTSSRSTPRAAPASSTPTGSGATAASNRSPPTSPASSTTSAGASACSRTHPGLPADRLRRSLLELRPARHQRRTDPPLLPALPAHAVPGRLRRRLPRRGQGPAG